MARRKLNHDAILRSWITLNAELRNLNVLELHDVLRSELEGARRRVIVQRIVNRLLRLKRSAVLHTIDGLLKVERERNIVDDVEALL